MNRFGGVHNVERSLGIRTLFKGALSGNAGCGDVRSKLMGVLGQAG